MTDLKTNSPPLPVERACLERCETEHRSNADSRPGHVPNSDLNALLAQEQTAIMSAEAATDGAIRYEQREVARHARALVDLTPFPRRKPHDFERLPPPVASPPDGAHQFMAELEALERHVRDMERDLALQFSEGKIGRKHNTLEHRSRLLRQARGRLHDLRSCTDGPATGRYP